MSPSIFGVPSYTLFIVLAVAAGLGAAVISARRARIPLGRLLCLEVVLISAAFGGAKLFWLWEMGLPRSPWNVPATLDGFRYPGGLLAVLAVLPLASRAFRIPVAALADLMAAPAAVAVAVVRVGCLLHGCCHGGPSALPWAVSFPRHSMVWNEHVALGLTPMDSASSLAVHPLQLYFGLWSAIVAVVLSRLQDRQRYPGQLVLTFLALHEGGKAVLESFRIPHRSDLQLVSLALALGGAGALLVNRRRWHPPLAVLANEGAGSADTHASA
jgi:phosphatidylglycerol:prolipoprotein diacylglycerol transferase